MLGVNKGDPLTTLQVDLRCADLGEFDQLLQTLGFEANGKKGDAAIPVVLHGALAFNGTARARSANLDVKGHLQATNLEVKLGTTTDMQIDSVVADAEYSPRRAGGGELDDQAGHGGAESDGDGEAAASWSRGGAWRRYVWDNGMTVDAKVQLANAQVADVLQIAGQQDKFR